MYLTLYILRSDLFVPYSKHGRYHSNSSFGPHPRFTRPASVRPSVRNGKLLELLLVFDMSKYLNKERINREKLLSLFQILQETVILILLTPRVIHVITLLAVVGVQLQEVME